MQQKNKQTDCTYFRELIVRSQWELLESAEHQQLESHLKSCPDCRAFLQQVQGLRTAIQTGPDIEPNASVKTHLLRAFRKRQEEKPTTPGAIHLLKSLFTYRLPVYQVVLLIAIAIGLWQWQSAHRTIAKQETIPAVSSNQPVQAEELPPKIKNHLQIIGKLNGSLSAKDDSILTRFVVTTM